MRVGLLIYGRLDTLSGGYLYDRKLVEYLRAQGDEVEIISLSWRGYARHLSDNFSPSLLKDLTRRRLDVLVQDELNHPSLFLLNRALGRLASFPRVALVHHLRSSEVRPGWQNWVYRQVERRYLRSVDGFIFNSQTTCGAVAETLAGGTQGRPFPDGKFPLPHVIAYPAGDRFQAALTPAEVLMRAGQLRLNWLFVGNLIPRKGLHTLIGALKLLRQAAPELDWRLEVAGRLDADRRYAGAILRQAGDGLAGRVNFCGAVSDARLAELLASSHVLVVPSSYEGFGIVYLEGMRFGLPAVGTTAGAAGESITHAQNGFLVPPGDAQELAGYLHRLTADRKMLKTMSLAALERAARHPTWAESGEKARAFLANLV